MIPIAVLIVVLPFAALLSILRTVVRIRGYYGRMAPRTAHLALASHGAGVTVISLLAIKNLHQYGPPPLVNLLLFAAACAGVFFLVTGIKYARGEPDSRLMTFAAAQVVIGVLMFWWLHHWLYIAYLPYSLWEPYRIVVSLVGWWFITIGGSKIGILLMGYEPPPWGGDDQGGPYGPPPTFNDPNDAARRLRR